VNCAAQIVIYDLREVRDGQSLVFICCCVWILNCLSVSVSSTATSAFSQIYSISLPSFFKSVSLSDCINSVSVALKVFLPTGTVYSTTSRNWLWRNKQSVQYDGLSRRATSQLFRKQIAWRVSRAAVCHTAWTPRLKLPVFLCHCGVVCSTCHAAR
jgi:hypothetical protein